MWLHSLKVAQLLRSAACLHTNQSRSYLNHLVHSEPIGQAYREIAVLFYKMVRFLVYNVCKSTNKGKWYNNEYQRYKVVRSNTTLLFVDVEQTDYMFRPLSIRPSSGLARGTTEEELTMLPSMYNTYCPKATGKNEISFVA